jgi:predicted nucleic acid-binding protein
MRRYVLDANALLGFLEARPGVAEKVQHLLLQAASHNSVLLMSAINWGEVFYLVWKHHGQDQAYEKERMLLELPISIMGADKERATRAGALRQKHHLGYADCFAAQLALEQRAWLVTADPEFSRVGDNLLLYALPRYERK